MGDEYFYFTCERLMGLFWVLIQQCCFVCIKYAHDDIVTVRGNGIRLVIWQSTVFIALAAFCFEKEIGLNFFRDFLLTDRIDYFPWVIRITLCSAMILFDSLLVLYFFRIVRVYSHGLEAARPTLLGDLAVFSLVSILCVGYIYTSVCASVRFDFSLAEYKWIGRFFIQISNFFYVVLEVSGAFMVWNFLKHLKVKEKLYDAR